MNRFVGSTSPSVVRAALRTLRKKSSGERRTYDSLRSLSSSVRYDSQSGLHVPVNNEDEVSLSVYLDNAKWGTTAGRRRINDPPTPLVGDFLESLLGGPGGDYVTGCAWTGAQDDEQMRKVAASALGRRLTHFVLSSAETAAALTDDFHVPPPVPSNVSLAFDYEKLMLGEEGDYSPERERVTSSSARARGTTLVLCDPCRPSGGKDPISVASDVASLIDSSSSGGFVEVEFIWLHFDYLGGESSSTPDDVLQLCEELSYLDVMGPTVKSRLVVDLYRSGDAGYYRDVMEECLGIGVNKFAAGSEQIESGELMRIAEESGKVVLKRAES